MASNSLKLVVFLLTILVRFFFLNFPTTQAEVVEVTAYDELVCSSENATSTDDSTFQENVKTLLSSLSSKATVRLFYNDTVGERNHSSSVFGLFMCRGDIPSKLCGQCILNATQTLSSDPNCYFSKNVVIWYYECMVRYSNSSFFSTMETNPMVNSLLNANFSNQPSFIRLLGQTLNKTADEAAYAPMGNIYFATKEAKVSENQTLYCLAQCTQDLSPQNCRACITIATGLLPSCCEGKLSAKVFFPSCNFRYELYPFYSHANASGQDGGLLSATNYLELDSIYPQDLGYLSHNCSGYEDGKYWQELIKTLLSYMTLNATSSTNNGFYTAQVEGTMFGLFMCRGDIPSHLCGQCVTNATRTLVTECSAFIEATIWYDHCFVRYSDQYFFYKMSTSPRFEFLNVTKVNNVEGSFKFTILSNALFKVAKMTVLNSNDEKYWRSQSFVLNDYQTVYTLAQCTRGLSPEDCYICLYEVIALRIPWSRLGSVGGVFLYPSCTLRFELFQFYYKDDGTKDQAPPPLSSINHAPRVESVIELPHVRFEVSEDIECSSEIELGVIHGGYQ